MLYFLISFVSLIWLSKSFSEKHFSAWTREIELLSHKFWTLFSSFLVSCFQRSNPVSCFLPLHIVLPSRKMSFCSKKMENVDEDEVENSILDLPDLALECVLERLSPAGLSSMSGVCRSFRDMARSDHLWKKHMERKWGRLIKDAALQEWQWHLASKRRTSVLDQSKRKGLFRSLIGMKPFSFICPDVVKTVKPRTSLPEDSIMALYVSLERGEFWFPAQVYNRENGHSGFMLSCYDAKVSYDSRADTFLARFSCYGRRTTEENVQWDRLRAPPINTPPYDLHNSDCLNELKPGDHLEIQWRRNKDFPYGWWYCVVGHLDSCNRNDIHCHCHINETIILEFNQYAPGSHWRRAVINRKEHQEVGDEAAGFYGGIRKLYNEGEVSTWKCLWPTKVLE